MMVRPLEAAGFLGLGAVLVANPLSQPLLSQTVGVEYAAHSVVTAAGIVYLVVGIGLVGLSLGAGDLTFGRTVAVAAGSITVVGGYYLDLGASEFAAWMPWFVAVLLVLPFGAATGRTRVAVVVLIGCALLVRPGRLAALGSPSAWNGPAMQLIWFVLGGMWTAVVGSPLYLVGRTVRRRDGGEGSK